MDKKDNFKAQLTKADMEASKARAEMDKHIEQIMGKIDIEIDKAVVKVLHELGLKEAREGMSIEEAEAIHQKLKEENKFINVSKDFIEGKCIVKVSVVECKAELTFQVMPFEED